MSGPVDVLGVTAEIAERRLAAGDVLFGQGDTAPTEVAVLVSGALAVELDGSLLAEITAPGAFVGEIGALLGTARTATVIAREESAVRLIGDPETFLAAHPELVLELARQLAGRLQRLLAYLADIRSQYADADGHLALVDSVLSRLATRPPVDIEPGSDRSPDY